MIKVLLLDFYGVLQTDEVIVWAEKQIQLVPDIRSAVDHASALIDVNAITLKQYYQELADAVQRPVESVMAELQNEIVINWPLIGIVDQIRAKGIITGILSNDGSSLLAYMDQHDISSHFDNIFVSGELGMMKPDPRVYKHVITELGVEPHEVMFFDDRQTNVDGALRGGMRAYVYESAEQVRKLLV